MVLSVRPLHIFLRINVDHDPRASADMRRHHDAHAVFEHGRLVAGGSGLPLHNRIGLNNQRFDRIGQLHRNRALIIKLQHDVHAVLQERRRITEHVGEQAICS